MRELHQRGKGEGRAILTTDTEALRAQFKELLSDSRRACFYEGDSQYAYPHDFSWFFYQAGYAAAKAEIAAAVAQERERCIGIIESHHIPVGNSAAGEMACEWTYDALKTIRDAIRAGVKEPDGDPTL